MLKRDNVWIGVILGLVLPGIAAFFVEVLKKNVRILEKDDLLYIGCAALNMILVKYLFKQYKENTARGVVASTFICALVFFLYKMR
ncbi:stationary phase survival protein SurE [Pararcticibacter amylolyticus]|uniref:Stationary phase survival protein SurE n=1 Tax=Pararcticibacter amylolyticus TaxID=2173175 RepID=A0A2U2PJV8_9SPHI|nr:stationary phase survival protein SurE [Pararcticibacter amylolyticus]PWG81429.1 stationary phase survival protein SurE [Pararcticibacter amylolyticus]